jgi:predicted nucleic acid-binding protein
LPSVLVDTGPLVALLDRNDRWHGRVRKFLSRYRGTLITTWPVLTEAASLCSAEEQLALLQMVESGAIEIPPQTGADAARVRWYLGKYRDRSPDLADLSLLALADATGVDSVLTIDSDFQIYRLKNARPLVDVLRR